MVGFCFVDAGVDFFDEVVRCGQAVHVVEEGFYIWGYVIGFALTAEEYFCGSVVEFQSFIFLADVTESVDMVLFIEKGKGAEEDDYGRAQFFVECAAGQRFHIDHGLVVVAAVG